MKRIVIVASLLVAPSAQAQIQEMQQNIFGMD